MWIMCWGLQTGVDGLEGMGVCLTQMCVSKLLLIPFIQGQFTHMGEWFINETRYESWRQSCERKGGWDLTGEGERDDKDITCPLVISALFIMPSPSSRMSPVRLSVWHWYGSTSLWHKLLLWLVITPATDPLH